MPLFRRTLQPVEPLDYPAIARGLRAIADGLDAGDTDAHVLIDDRDLHPDSVLAYLDSRTPDRDDI
ncbi:hypothetical protein [Streptomyces sp. NPDC012888]|uniref:hypothetical protein n=1 Tax=Streptomyces sp. NPDC012888 TaxID=3364855 RepID=UPI0036B9C8B5